MNRLEPFQRGWMRLIVAAAFAVVLTACVKSGEGSTLFPEVKVQAFRPIQPNAEITTVGSGYKHPYGVAVDGAGDVFVADTEHGAIKKVAPNGTVTTVGSFAFPVDVKIAKSLYVANQDFPAAAYKVAPNGKVTKIFSGVIAFVVAVAVNTAGDVYVATYNPTYSDLDGVVEITPHGEHQFGHFARPGGLSVAKDGSVYVSDGNTVYKVSLGGKLTRVGSGFHNPGGVAVDGAGDVFVADTGHSAIKKVAPDGQITTVGSGFAHPNGVAVDTRGNVYVADTFNNAVKKVTP